ncbi:unnamed protein product [Rodentolepis nana]|uniref:Secreted protein n=1 Tax=Rodentolepis nana TaxID=102285 RepID=A0A0R3TLQ2_RODNA|nr:unnamed protein product [Rodentolepis nana]
MLTPPSCIMKLICSWLFIAIFLHIIGIDGKRYTLPPGSWFGESDPHDGYQHPIHPGPPSGDYWLPPPSGGDRKYPNSPDPWGKEDQSGGGPPPSRFPGLWDGGPGDTKGW